MPNIGPGAYEIRIHTGVEHRIFYIAKLPDGVYVLHAFPKRTQKTPIQDINLARSRLSQLTRMGLRGRPRKKE